MRVGTDFPGGYAGMPWTWCVLKFPTLVGRHGVKWRRLPFRDDVWLLVWMLCMIFLWRNLTSWQAVYKGKTDLQGWMNHFVFLLNKQAERQPGKIRFALRASGS